MMRRATKGLVLLLVLTMAAMALLAGTVTALAEEAEPPQETTEATTEAAPVIRNAGIIEVLVWDDSINPDAEYSDEELVDGITVNLYRSDQNDDRTTWTPYTLVGSQKTGIGGYGVFGYEGDPNPVYQHGWAGWNALPVRTDRPTKYKMELVLDSTFNALNGTVREVELWDYFGLHYKWFAPLASDPDNPLSGYQIQSTTVTISGVVWSDANADLTRQWAEQRLSGWTVILTNKYGWKISSTTTNANGYYQFRGLKSGTYKVWVCGQRNWKQVAPYYKLCTWPPWGCEKGHHVIAGQAGNYYVNNDFGLLDMRDSTWSLLYYGLWWVGLLQYQFK
jgi:hypothetical protein